MNKKDIKDKILKYNVVIDGASGILGYDLAKFFSENVEKVILVGRSLKNEYKRRNLLKRDNIEYYNNYVSIPKTKKVESVFIHTASSTPNNNNFGDKSIFDQNAELRKKVAEHILSSKYKLIVNISSMSVYGKIDQEFLCEEYRTLPTNLYGLSKLLSEYQFSIISRLSTDTKVINLRLPGIVSKEVRGIFIASLLDKIKNNKPIRIFSKDSLFNNATTSIDIARTIKKIILQQETLPKEVFLNMHSRDSLSINEIIIYLAEQLKKDLPELIFDKEISTFLIKNKWNSNLVSNSLLFNMFREISEIN